MKILLTNKQKINQISLIFKNLKNISTDVEMIVQENRIYIQGMDSGHVCLFELELKSYWFDKFEYDGEDITIGINCELIHKIINCREEYQNIELKTTKSSEKLFITLFPREGQNGFTKEFEVPMIDIDSELLDVPTVDYDADIEIQSCDFTNLVHQLGQFGKDMNVICNDQIEFKGTGEYGTMKAIIEQEQILMYAVAEETEVNLVFNIEYVNKMVSFSKLNAITKIHFGSAYPMKLQYDLDFVMDEDDDEDDEESEVNNYIRFFLAPKIEDS